MKPPIELVLVEDFDDDATLALRALRHGEIKVQQERAQRATEMQAALNRRD